MQSTSSKITSSHVASGTIEKIQLKNFMCHANLEFSFGDCVNFVTGRNGSGKSAVLAGIVIGLGGKATSMNRGRAVKEYVKTGCNTAEIAITFSNEGSDAFQRAKYGDKITVERKIHATGGGGYKLKNEDGKVVSDKREELIRLLHHFNIELNNPVTILSQDVSRQFLQSMKPDVLYQFFMRATRLEQMREDLDIIEGKLKQTSVIMKNRAEALLITREQVKKLHSSLQRHQSLQGLREKLAELSKELAWSQVIAQESVVDEYKTKIGELETRQIEFDEGEVKVKAEADALEQERVDLETRQKDFKNRLDESKRTYENAERQFRTLSEISDQKKSAFENIKRNIERSGFEEQQLLKQIQEAQEQTADKERYALRKEKIARLEEVEREVAEKKQKCETFRTNRERITNEINETRNELRDKRSELAGVDRKIADNRAKIDNLTASTKNKLAKFGQANVKLVQMIDDAVKRRKLLKRPRGPLGADVTVRDGRWTLAAEVCLSSQLLCGYVCDNFDDSKLLEQMMNSCGFRFRPMIIITEFGDEQPYDVTANVPQCPYPTMLSVLDIKDPLVRNVLIDQKSIEEIVLMEDDEQMRQIMHNNPPTVVAFSMSGSQCYASPDFRYYPSMKENATYLASSIVDVLRKLQATNEELTRSKQKLAAIVENTARSLNEREMNVQRSKEDLIKSEKQINEMNAYCRRLTREIENLAPQDVDVGYIENERRFVLDAIHVLQENLEKAKEAKDLAAEEATTKDAETAELKRRYRRMHIEHEEERRNCAHIVEQIAKKNAVLRKIRSTKVEIVEKLTKWRADLIDETRDLQDLIVQAEKLSKTRYATKRKSDQVEKDLLRHEQILAEGEEDIGDFYELKKNYEDKKAKLDAIEEERNELIDFLDKLDEAVKIREYGYRLIRSNVTTQMRVNFMQNLQCRNYSGKLLISHKQKKIEIKVQTHNEAVRNADDEVRDLRGLSGGERSFATVSFVLSLWQLADAPFRCLDEFDVFMDMVSRHIALDMILRFADTHRDMGQFVLLTPMNINKFIRQHGENVSVFELEPPHDQPTTSRKRRHAADDYEED